MQRALLFSMNPIPPMSAASWKTASAPFAARWQLSLSLRSATVLSTSGKTWCHSSRGFTSTARMTLTPFSRRHLTRCPPINPPPPHTTAACPVKSMFSVILLFTRRREHLSVIEGPILDKSSKAKLRIRLEQRIQVVGVAEKDAAQRTPAQNDRDQREHQRFRIGAAQLAPLDPRLQIPYNHLYELSEMSAQKRIEIVAQFQCAVLQQSEQLRLLLQGC